MNLTLKNLCLLLIYSFIPSLIIIGGCIIKKEFKAVKKSLFSFIVIPTLICLVLLITTLLLSVHAEKRVETVTSKVPIVSLSTVEGTSGNIVLGTGNVESNQYYYYYTQEGNKYKLNKVNSDDVSIIEENGQPRIETKYNKKMRKISPGEIADTLHIDLFKTNWYEEFDLIDNMLNKEKILYIPKGSIKQNFNPNPK